MSEAKILIVEDEGIEALDIQQRLLSMGYSSIEIVASGEEAVEKVAEIYPDLVLMDIMLQGEIDGVMAAEQIQARFDIPIIYLTAYTDEDTLQRAKITEPYGYLVKPFQERELRITIDMALYKHQMEKKLKERERWFSTTLRSIGDAVIATDNNGHVTFMNPVAEVLTGWKLAEVQNKKLTEIFKIINRDTRQPVDNPVAKVLSESTTVGLANHIKLIARNGIETSIDDSASPIKDDYGALLGVILVFRDVTEREKAEKELKEADRRKDEFLAMLAHEMRNPLAPIRNAVQILDLARPKDPLIEKHGKIIDRQVTHMARLLEDLLDVSRIAQGKITLKKEQFDLRTVVLQAVEIAAHTAQDRPLEIKCVSTPPEPLWIDGDYTRLEQVFGNLLNNAIKYTDRGQIIVTLKREKTCNGEGAWATVAVRDTGIGIPPKLLPGIFDLFTQVDQSLDRSRGGLGIGLTMVKRLTEMHGGWVKAYSAGSGTGSEFIVRLPLTQ